jgi:DNA repair protein SbcD/Mre11
VKILQINDIHLRSDDYGDDVKMALAGAGNLIRDQRVDVVCINGDIFDAASTPSQRLYFKHFLNHIPTRVLVLIIPGNHDQRGDLSIYHDPDRLIHVVEKPCAMVFAKGMKGYVPKGEQELDCGPKYEFQVCFLPHFNPALVAREELSLEGMVEESNNLLDDIMDYFFQQVKTHPGPSIFMGHCEVDGAQFSSGYIPKDNGIHIKRAQLQILGIPCLLGHIHKYQALSENIVYSGNISRMNFGEANDDKGVVIWEQSDTGEWSHEFHSLNPRPMWDLKAYWNPNEIEDPSNPEKRGSLIFTEPINQFKPEFYKGARVKIAYEVEESEIHSVDLTSVYQIFSQAHELKIEMRPKLTTAARNLEIVQARTIPDKLTLWAKAKGMEDKVPMLIECHNELTEEKESLNREQPILIQDQYETVTPGSTGGHGENPSEGNTEEESNHQGGVRRPSKSQEPDQEGDDAGSETKKEAPETGKESPELVPTASEVRAAKARAVLERLGGNTVSVISQPETVQAHLF